MLHTCFFNVSCHCLTILQLAAVKWLMRPQSLQFSMTQRDAIPGRVHGRQNRDCRFNGNFNSIVQNIVCSTDDKNGLLMYCRYIVSSRYKSLSNMLLANRAISPERLRDLRPPLVGEPGGSKRSKRLEEGGREHMTL